MSNGRFGRVVDRIPGGVFAAVVMHDARGKIDARVKVAYYAGTRGRRGSGRKGERSNLEGDRASLEGDRGKSVGFVARSAG